MRAPADLNPRYRLVYWPDCVAFFPQSVVTFGEELSIYDHYRNERATGPSICCQLPS